MAARPVLGRQVFEIDPDRWLALCGFGCDGADKGAGISQPKASITTSPMEAGTSAACAGQSYAEARRPGLRGHPLQGAGVVHPQTHVLAACDQFCSRAHTPTSPKLSMTWQKYPSSVADAKQLRGLLAAVKIQHGVGSSDIFQRFVGLTQMLGQQLGHGRESCERTHSMSWRSAQLSSRRMQCSGSVPM